MCMSNCTKGIHKTDPKKDQYWECNVLAKCAWGAASGENCMIKGCCQEPGKTCFAKVEGYGQCRMKCPKGWDCTKVTKPHPQLAFPCNKKYEQCGGDGFRRNPCCQEGLVCHGKQPAYYMQCVSKDEANNTNKKAADDDDDEVANVDFSAQIKGLPEDKNAHAQYLGFYAFGAAFMIVASAAFFIARQQMCQRRSSHKALCTDDDFQEETFERVSLEG